MTAEEKKARQEEWEKKDQEKKELLKRRKAIWDKMTPEEQQEAEKKRKEIVEWSNEEEDKIVDRLKAEGRWRYGVLDGYYPEIVEHHRQYKKRLYDLIVSLFGEENAGEWNI